MKNSLSEIDKHAITIPVELRTRTQQKKILQWTRLPEEIYLSMQTRTQYWSMVKWMIEQHGNRHIGCGGLSHKILSKMGLWDEWKCTKHGISSGYPHTCNDKGRL